jgi:3-deoxy-manno-octulosonate cytidylyltransferase (CMP-KDO synthetase)
MRMNYVVIIPARYESSRFQGKPLINLSGTPMIVRTYRQCIKASPPERVFVATDHERVKDVCEQHGAQVLMTSKACLTGTDRVAECARQLDADVFVNVQGDEPIFDSRDITTLIDAAQRYPEEVLNGVCNLYDEDQYRSGSIPKAVMRLDGHLLYMSRSEIPSTKGRAFVKSWRQVCAYVFPRRALEAFARHGKKTPLEGIEDIEILRFLELGWNVRMVPLSSQSLSVDTPEDVTRVEQMIARTGM